MIDTNITPYNDDFDEQKLFDTILFRSDNVTVQARELNQIQTILDNKITKIGDHFFENGSSVIGGGLTIKNKITVLSMNDISGDINELIGNDVTITQNFIDYRGYVHTTKDSKIFISFVDSELDVSVDQVGFNVDGTLKYTGIITTKAIGTVASFNSGVYYLDKKFVLVEGKNVVVADDNSNDINVVIGFNKSDEIVTSLTDETLYSNATGTPNFKADGAHRLKVSAEAVKYDIGSQGTHFIELSRIENGVLVSKKPNVNYNVLEDVLATRTFDESGNYTVEDFDLELDEHDEIFDVGDETKVVATLKRGNAYVNGYNVYTNSERRLVLDKARDTKVIDDVATTTNYDNYIESDVRNGLPEIDFNRPLYLYKQAPFIPSTDDIDTENVGANVTYDEPNNKLTFLNTHEDTTDKDSVLVVEGNGTQIGELEAFSFHINSLDQLVANGGTFIIGIFDPENPTYLVGGFKSYLKIYESFGEYRMRQYSQGSSTFVGTIQTDWSVKIYTNAGSDQWFFKVYDGGSNQVYLGVYDANSAIDTHVIKIITNDLTNTNDTATFSIDATSDPYQLLEIVSDDYYSTSGNDVVYTYVDPLVVTPADKKITFLDGDPAGLFVGDFSVEIITPGLTLKENDFIDFGINDIAVTGHKMRIKRPSLILSNTSNEIEVYAGGSLITISIGNITKIKIERDSGVIKYYVFDGGSNIPNWTLLYSFSHATDVKLDVSFETETNYELVSYLYITPPDTTPPNHVAGWEPTPYGKVICKDVTSNGNNIKIHLIESVIEGGFNIEVDDKVEQTLSDNSKFFGHIKNDITGIDNSKDVFALPNNVIKSLIPNGSNTSFYSTESFIETSDGTGSLSIILTGSNIFESGNVVFAHHHQQNADTGDIGAFNSIVGVGNINILNGNKTMTISGLQASEDYVIVTRVKNNSAVHKQKTVANSIETISFTETNSVTLSKQDGIKINSISFEGEDVTNSFIFDGGQRNDKYENVSIRSVSGQNVDDGDYTVDYDYFSHIVSGKFFSVDSYSVPYDEIPSYNGLRLSDVLDFRPRYDSINEQYLDTHEVISTDSTILTDEEIYVPYKVSVYLDEDGNFSHVKGISGENNIPVIPENTMRLYNLDIPAYTFDVSDIFVRSIDNKRYTMRDIGRLENRLRNVEYFVSLNALEQSAENSKSLDESGLDRFKNGFVTDDFSGFNTIDNESENTFCSVGDGSLKPPFKQNLLEYDAGTLTNISNNDDIFTLGFTESVMIDQQKATGWINVNPFQSITWNGAIKLSPDKDYWQDTVYNAPLIINKIIDRTGGQKAGTITNSWMRPEVIQDSSAVGRFVTAPFSGEVDLTTKTIKHVEKSTVSKDIIGEEKVGIRTIPFMRSTDITFVAEGLKPKTQVYPFFSGKNITVNCKPNGGSYGDTLTTDEFGKIEGVFTVPSSRTESIKTGQNIFRLSDSATNSYEPTEFKTSASTIHDSKGLSDVKRRKILSTRTVTVESLESITTKRVNVSGFIREYDDPIAQTFLVTGSGGNFVSSVDVFFRTKDDTIPVTLQIRTVENGIPTNNVVVEKTLEASGVNISNDASTVTNFTFDHPVYLKDTLEYAIVLLSDSVNYNAFISEMGETSINGFGVIDKQPTLGSLLISQNGSTWTPEQTKDLMFRINKCVFDTSGSLTLTSKENDGLSQSDNPLQSFVNSKTVRINELLLGLIVGDTVTISGVTSANGLEVSEVNGNHVITAITDNYTEFEISGGDHALSTGFFGTIDTKIKMLHPYSLLFNAMRFVESNGTKIDFSIRYKEQGTRIFGDWLEFIPNKNIDLIKEGIQLSAGDVEIKMDFSSDLDNISPIFDMNGSSSVLVHHKISPDFDVCKAISKKLSFKNTCSAVRIICDVYSPNGTKVDFDVSFGDDVFVELDTNIGNDDTRFVEIDRTYDLAFESIYIRFLLRGESVNYPMIKNLRVIALA